MCPSHQTHNHSEVSKRKIKLSTTELSLVLTFVDYNFVEFVRHAGNRHSKNCHGASGRENLAVLCAKAVLQFQSRIIEFA